MVTSESVEQGANFSVTPNHRMVIANRKSGNWRLEPASELGRLGDSVIPTGWNAIPVMDGDTPFELEVISSHHMVKPLKTTRVNFAKFLGLWIAEGCLSEQHVVSTKETRYVIRIAQKIYPDEVRKILADIGIAWSEYIGGNGVTNFNIQHRALYDFLEKTCDKVKSADKYIPDFIMSWGSDSLQSLIDGLMLGDGRHNIDDADGYRIATETYFTTSKQLANDVQCVAARLGRATVIHSQDRVTPYAPDKVSTIYMVRFHVAQQALIGGMPLVNRDYKGYIRCVTVPNGMIVVRRGGRPMVCGNCQFWAQDPDGRIYLYREIYKTKTLVEDHAKKIIEVAGWQRDGGDPLPFAIIRDHDAEDGATLERHLHQAGIHIMTTRAIKNVSAGINASASRMKKAGDGKPRLYILRDSLVEIDRELQAANLPYCTLHEFDSYVWNEKKDAPIKEADHGMDCLRYVCMHLEAPRNVETVKSLYH